MRSLEPAVIYNETKFRQSLLFEGMQRHRGISPTDIDLAIDYNGKSFLFGECKKAGVGLGTGQRRYFQHLVKSIKIECPVIVILFEHDVPDDEDIVARTCKAVSIYTNRAKKEEDNYKWLPCECSLMQVIRRWERLIRKELIWI